jgi:hypothetical protein
MDKLRRAWTAFRAMPAIVRFGICLALAILAMLATPKEAFADLVLRNDGSGAELRLLSSACSPPPAPTPEPWR